MPDKQSLLAHRASATKMYKLIGDLHDYLISSKSEMTEVEGGKHAVSIDCAETDPVVVKFTDDVYAMLAELSTAKLPPRADMTYDDMMYNATCQVFMMLRHFVSDKLARQAFATIFKAEPNQADMIKQLAAQLGGVAVGVTADGKVEVLGKPAPEHTEHDAALDEMPELPAGSNGLQLVPKKKPNE